MNFRLWHEMVIKLSTTPTRDLSEADPSLGAGAGVHRCRFLYEPSYRSSLPVNLS